MWATLALTAALNLAPAQPAALDFANVRTTYGILGQERKDAKEPKILPGEMLVVSYDITGLTVNKDGRVAYSMGMELYRKGKEKPEFKREPTNLETTLNLGGDRVPNYAQAYIGTDVPPGEYSMLVTVADRANKATKVLTQKFEVLKPTLGFVGVRLTYETNQPAPPLAVPGQLVLLHFSVVGFELDKKLNPHVGIEMQIIDDATGKPTIAKPLAGEVKTIGGKEFEKLIPFDALPIQLNRPGKFTINLKVTDNHSKKTVEQALSLTVTDLNK
jgi:hypothetical protein